MFKRSYSCLLFNANSFLKKKQVLLQEWHGLQHLDARYNRAPASVQKKYKAAGL